MHIRIKTGQWVITCLLGWLLVTGAACKKVVQQQYEDMMVKMMTDGSWTITRFSENGSDITPSFNAWICKFYDNKTMVATQGSTIQGGTWQSDSNNKTISAQFSNSVGDPLQKLNGTWTITSALPTVATFAQTKNGISYSMELTKY